MLAGMSLISGRRSRFEAERSQLTQDVYHIVGLYMAYLENSEQNHMGILFLHVCHPGTSCSNEL